MNARELEAYLRKTGGWAPAEMILEQLHLDRTQLSHLLVDLLEETDVRLDRDIIHIN